MYEQIARNKRLAVTYMVLFFFVWVGIGALLGLRVAAMAQSSESWADAKPGEVHPRPPHGEEHPGEADQPVQDGGRRASAARPTPTTKVGSKNNSSGVEVR